MNTQLQKPLEKENQLTLELLQAIDSKDDISQRHLAQEMGVALGLANSYLKRCVKKGWIKITTAPANRYLYYLTPTGFAQKARLTSEFLSTSLTLFRQSGNDYTEIFADCAEKGDRRIIFAGLSDLTEIAYMKSLQTDIDVIQVFQPETSREAFFELQVCNDLEKCSECDRIVMTSMEQTNDLLSLLSSKYSADQIVVPTLLINMQYRNDENDTSEVVLNESNTPLASGLE